MYSVSPPVVSSSAEVASLADVSPAELPSPVVDPLLSAGSSFEQAAAVPVSATTALVGARAASLSAGQTVLITGAGGGVGSYAVQIARALGAEVTGVCSTAKAPFVRSLGAAHVIDYTEQDFTAAGRQYDAIIDLAKEAKIVVREETLTRHDAYTADEVFLTGSGAEVIPVVKIDNRVIGDGKPGPMTKQLTKRFHELTRL